MGNSADIVSFSSSVAAVRNSNAKHQHWDSADWTKAIGAVSVLSSRGLETDLVCVNSLIAACERFGRWQSATALFKECGLSLDSAGYGALISSSKVEVEGAWRLALTWLRLSPANQICYNSCVDACEKGGQWQVAFLLIDRMPVLDEVSFTCRISACYKWEEAASTLWLMGTQRTLPNLRSYSAAISSQPWRVAVGYWRDMSSQSVQPNDVAGNALISAEKLNWKRATALLTITSAGIQLSLFGINSCLVGPPGYWPLASRMLASVQELMVECNVDSFSAVLSAYEKSIMWSEALHTWLRMLNQGVRPDVASGNAMISAFAQGLCWKSALEFFGRIRCTISADFITRNAILTSCGGVHCWQIALGFFGGSQSPESPDMEAQSVMIASCTSSFQWSLGLRLLERMDFVAGQALAIAITSSLTACFGDAYVGLGSLQRVPQLFSHLEDSATLACAVIKE